MKLLKLNILFLTFKNITVRFYTTMCIVLAVPFPHTFLPNCINFYKDRNISTKYFS